MRGRKMKKTPPKYWVQHTEEEAAAQGKRSAESPFVAQYISKATEIAVGQMPVYYRLLWGLLKYSANTDTYMNLDVFNSTIKIDEI